LSLLRKGRRSPAWLNPGGASEAYSNTGGGMELTGPFFRSMGSNGRSSISYSLRCNH